MEKYLKRSNWCVYQNSTQLYDLLRNYSQNNIDYAENPEVISLISKKTQSKSIIKVDEKEATVRLKIFDGTEHPSYSIQFETKKFNSLESLITELVESLDTYSRIIPYDGVVIGKSENIVTISSGKEFGFRKGLSVTFLSELKRNNHPLYKFVIDYDFKKFCNGVVLQSDFGMSLVELNQSDPGCTQVSRGVFVKKERFSDNFQKVSPFSRKKDKIFSLIPGVGISSTSLTITNSGKTVLSGISPSVETKVSARITKNYFLLSDLKLGVSSLSASEGSASDQTPVSSDFSFGGRYQVSNIKQTKINFDMTVRLFDFLLSNDSTSSLSKFSHTSLFVSSDMLHQFNKNVTGVLGVGFSIYNSQEFESNYLGSIESGNRYRFRIGAWIENVYKFKIYTGLNVDSININFSGENKDIQLTDLGLMSSLFFQF